MLIAFIYKLLSVALPSGLRTPHVTPLFFNMTDSEEISSSRIDGALDHSVGAAIQSAVC